MGFYFYHSIKFLLILVGPLDKYIYEPVKTTNSQWWNEQSRGGMMTAFRNLHPNVDLTTSTSSRTVSAEEVTPMALIDRNPAEEQALQEKEVDHPEKAKAEDTGETST